MKKKLISLLRDIPLKLKILSIIISINVVLVGSLSILGVKYITNENNKLLYRSMASSLSYSATDIENVLKSVERMSNMIIADTKIQNQLSEVKNSNVQITISNAYKELYTEVGNYYSEYKDASFIEYISLYNDKFATHTYFPTTDKLSNDAKEHLLEVAYENKGSAVWISEYAPTNKLYLTREIREIKDLSLANLGTLVVCIDIEKLIDDITYFDNQYEKSYYLLYDSERLIYNSEELSYSDSKIIQDELDSNYGVLELGGNRFFGTKGAIPNYNWEYICLVSYDAIHQAIKLSLFMYIIIMIITILIASLFTNKLVSLITIHINTLILKIKKFRGETSEIIDIGYNYDARKDEFGLLHQYFDSMAIEIQDLINENYKKEILAKESQLQALQSQINPHFLYNVLESINWRAKGIGEKNISLMVESLGGLLRTTLSSDKYITIEQEINLVQLYMNIQQIRYEEQLHFNIKVDEKLLNNSIPKLTIQPLVENAVHHALEKVINDCFISVEILLDNENILIKVMNSESHFEENLLKKLYQKKITPNGLGIGLMNINNRIKLVFGESYGLTVYNENDYAVAMITIPYIA